MLSFGPPWKLALAGSVGFVAGVALFLTDWQLSALVAFVAMFFVARGALHLATTSFEGTTGALSALQGGGEMVAGLLLLVWPSPTLVVLTVVVGVVVGVESIVDGVVVLTTRDDVPHWTLRVMVDLVEVVLAIALVARPEGTVDASAMTLGAIALVAGTLEIATALQRGHRPQMTAVQG
jgi:uncharacterized membrane protein HdeD (DUF308 family)